MHYLQTKHIVCQHFSISASVICIVIACFALTSCASTKSAVYFNNIGDSTILVAIEKLEPVIHKNDLLSINVSSANAEFSKVFNQETDADASGYLVDQEGIITLPILGELNAAGKTKRELRDYILKQLLDKRLLRDPKVDIRYLNYKISVLGEVGHPSVLAIPSEKVSILEAISMAGDLTLNARRERVMLIREDEGSRTVKRLDLTESSLLSSPYYYLKSNDVIYVEPNRTKIAGSSRFNLIFPILISSISLGILVVDRIVR